MKINRNKLKYDLHFCWVLVLIFGPEKEKKYVKEKRKCVSAVMKQQQSYEITPHHPIDILL